jgi:hypothetical protein
MFSFSDLKDIHLEITNRCQASCPMCSRNYHGGLENPLIKNNDWTLEDFKKIISIDVLEQINGFYFCGNFGDPIINDELIEMVEYAATINPKLNIRIHTNGSARNIDWWTRLATVLPDTHNVIFAIDGLEDTHKLYRIGTSYKKILQNAKAFIDAGGTAEWCFIKFKHNEHQIEQAQDIAKQLGFSLFVEKNSSRFIGTPKFPVYNKTGETTHYLEAPSNSDVTFITEDTVKNYKDILSNSKIDCYVLQTKEVYIDAYKNIFPCCFLASTPYNYAKPNDITTTVRTHMHEQYLDLIEKLGNTNALENTLQQVIDSLPWQTVWKNYWGDDMLITCARTCGRSKELPKPKDQFIKVIGLNNE